MLLQQKCKQHGLNDEDDKLKQKVGYLPFRAYQGEPCGFFRELREIAANAEPHKGGCILFDRKEQVQSLL